MAEGEKSSQRVANVKDEFCSTQTGITRMFRDLRPSHCLLKIDSYSLFDKEKYESDDFEVGGYKWRLVFYPDGDTKRNGKGFISLYISIVETNDLPQAWEVNVSFKLFVLDQTREKYLTIQDGEGSISRFTEVKMERGFPQLLSLQMFKNASNGYLIDDSCVLGAEVFVLKCACKLQQNNSRVILLLGRLIDSRHWIRSCITLKHSLFREYAVDAAQEKEPVNTDFTLYIQDQVSGEHHEKPLSHLFTTTEDTWGPKEFIKPDELHDSLKSFIWKDSVMVGVEFTEIKTSWVKTIFSELLVE